jgi:hypothetical protein
MARGTWTDLLLVLLVDGVKSIFDGDSLHIASCHLQAEREPQIDLLDKRLAERLLEGILIIDGGR